MGWYETPYGYLAIADMAKMYDVTTDTVYSWIRCGMLKADRNVGTLPRYWISDAALQEFDDTFGDLLQTPRDTNLKKPFMPIGKLMAKRWKEISERQAAERAKIITRKVGTDPELKVEGHEYVLDSDEGIYDGFDKMLPAIEKKEDSAMNNQEVYTVIFHLTDGTTYVIGVFTSLEKAFHEAGQYLVSNCIDFYETGTLGHEWESSVDASRIEVTKYTLS